MSYIKILLTVSLILHSPFEACRNASLHDECLGEAIDHVMDVSKIKKRNTWRLILVILYCRSEETMLLSLSWKDFKIPNEFISRFRRWRLPKGRSVLKNFHLPIIVDVCNRFSLFLTCLSCRKHETFDFFPLFDLSNYAYHCLRGFCPWARYVILLLLSFLSLSFAPLFSLFSLTLCIMQFVF